MHLKEMCLQNKLIQIRTLKPPWYRALLDSLVLTATGFANPWA